MQVPEKNLEFWIMQLNKGLGTLEQVNNYREQQRATWHLPTCPELDLPICYRNKNSTKNTVPVLQ